MMKNDNVIQNKSFAFSIRVVKACKYLNEKNEFVLSKQLLKSGTSIGANVEEAIGGHSNADFVSKITIAYKEARETLYWIRLLGATGHLNKDEVKSLLEDSEELCRILGKIQVTTKKVSKPKSKSSPI